MPEEIVLKETNNRATIIQALVFLKIIKNDLTKLCWSTKVRLD